MTSTKRLPDSGREFEQRALALARAIYDPSGLQGSAMLDGREHDGVFLAENSITALEFTQMRTVEKVKSDAMKIAVTLKRFGGEPNHRYKSLQGLIVTLEEPTADQRKAVAEIARMQGVQIDLLSSVTLRSRLVDTESYLALRRAAPFGSAGVSANPRPGELNLPTRYVEPHLKLEDGASVTLDELIGSLRTGGRTVVTADFGAGKSEALRQIFERQRKQFFKSSASNRFPIHLNLRDLYGLRTPREVLARHAQEIGFPGTNGLIAAWRSGACDLLLDGFDELVPSRWAGGVRDLRQVRWQALKPVRDLVSETPRDAGIVLAGRAQYFSGSQELFECLGIKHGTAVHLKDFDDQQVMNFLSDTSASLPEWLPARPLLLSFIAQFDLLQELGSTGGTEAGAWLRMIKAISDREAERVDSLNPSAVLDLLARVATLARSGTESLGPITMSDMRLAFREVCGYEPDEQGLQLLLRLPGLTSSDVEGAHRDDEQRTFADHSIADAAYGCDLANYIGAPYSNHPLAKPISWTVAGSSLVSGVAARSLSEKGFEPGVLRGAVRQRADAGQSDAVLVDLANAADAMGADLNGSGSLFISEVIIPALTLDDDCALKDAHFKDCVLEWLDVSDVEDVATLPKFEDCIIGTVLGWPSIPEGARGHFAGSEIGAFEVPPRTNDALLGLSLQLEDRLALVVLRKVYAQKGKGRKAGALTRGLPPAERGQVGAVVDQLVTKGYLTRESRSRGDGIILPVKGRRAEVMAKFDNAERFRLHLL